MRVTRRDGATMEILTSWRSLTSPPLACGAALMETLFPRPPLALSCATGSVPASQVSDTRGLQLKCDHRDCLRFSDLHSSGCAKVHM